MDMTPGDLVRHPMYPSLGIARIIRIWNGGHCSVHFSGRDLGAWPSRHLERACRSCGKFVEAHMPNKRCLFGASKWT